MSFPEVTAVVLAGGRSSRMGGDDKGLIPFRGQPMIVHILETLSHCVDHILINANRNLDRYQAFGYPLISDANRNFDGPLAGFLAAMQAAQTPEVLLLPCDSPLISEALVQRLREAKQAADAEIAVAHDGRRLQPVYALLAVNLKDSLQDYLARGERKIDLWFPQHKMLEVDCSDIPEVFANVNTPEELGRLEQAEP